VLLAIGDAVWIAGIGVLQAVALAIVGLFIRRMDINAKKRDDARAVEVDGVKTTLQKTTSETSKALEDIAKVGHDTHTLVNNNMAVQLRLNKAVTERLAGLTKDPDDRAAADLAATVFAEHEAKQRQVDSETKARP
jgi:hypothetical protein